MDYDKQMEVMRTKNDAYLTIFESNLKASGLTPKTITRHINNVGFYINEFLCYYDLQEMPAGCYNIEEFLGDWFIRKAMWSTAATIKANAASIKKFYASMLKHGHIEKEDYQELVETIREGMPYWIEKVEDYNNGEHFFF